MALGSSARTIDRLSGEPSTAKPQPLRTSLITGSPAAVKSRLSGDMEPGAISTLTIR